MAGTRRQALDDAREQIKSLLAGTIVGEECPFHARSALEEVDRELGDALNAESNPAPLSLLMAARHRGTLLGLRAMCNPAVRTRLERIASCYRLYLTG